MVTSAFGAVPGLAWGSRGPPERDAAGMAVGWTESPGVGGSRLRVGARGTGHLVTGVLEQAAPRRKSPTQREPGDRGGGEPNATF